HSYSGTSDAVKMERPSHYPCRSSGGHAHLSAILLRSKSSLQQLQRITLLIAHETFTVTTETTKGRSC
ncbi:hypothetical protein, partial [Pectobacterium carotovorum]|uniref:hypothetical protein n=1 Tax=Pectobacterium brasiliense TaxID=180957 RepID=UPI001BDFCBEF